MVSNSFLKEKLFLIRSSIKSILTKKAEISRVKEENGGKQNKECANIDKGKRSAKKYYTKINEHFIKFPVLQGH